MEKEKNCTSCGVRLIGRGVAYFPCPMCAEEEIGRCVTCRDQSVEYVCSNCGFMGP